MLRCNHGLNNKMMNPLQNLQPVFMGTRRQVNLHHLDFDIKNYSLLSSAVS